MSLDPARNKCWTLWASLTKWRNSPQVASVSCITASSVWFSKTTNSYRDQGFRESLEGICELTPRRRLDVSRAPVGSHGFGNRVNVKSAHHYSPRGKGTECPLGRVRRPAFGVRPARRSGRARRVAPKESGDTLPQSKKRCAPASIFVVDKAEGRVCPCVLCRSAIHYSHSEVRLCLLFGVNDEVLARSWLNRNLATTRPSSLEVLHRHAPCCVDGCRSSDRNRTPSS